MDGRNRTRYLKCPLQCLQEESCLGTFVTVVAVRNRSIPGDQREEHRRYVVTVPCEEGDDGRDADTIGTIFDGNIRKGLRC